MSTFDSTVTFTAELEQPVPALADGTPPVTIINHANGAVTASATDGHGNRVMITATAESQPWLVRYVMRQLLPALMPGARREADHA